MAVNSVMVMNLKVNRKMKIDFRQTPHYWINLDEHVKNATEITAQFDRLGFRHERVPGVKESPYIVGCGKAHIAALARAIEVGIFPCCIYEDDATVSEHYKPEIEVPDGADALYLGISLAGQPRFTKVTDDVCRVVDMMSLHAVCYTSKKYAVAAKNKCEQCVYKDNYPHDVGTAQILRWYNVYACNRPYFFQSDDRESQNKWQGYTDKILYG